VTEVTGGKVLLMEIERRRAVIKSEQVSIAEKPEILSMDYMRKHLSLI
jgi:hypothetical protein